MIDSVASDTDKVNEEKVGKLRIITSYTCNLFQNYFKGKKYDGFLFNWKKILLIILCWNSRLGVDFKIESVLQARERK